MGNWVQGLRIGAYNLLFHVKLFSGECEGPATSVPDEPASIRILDSGFRLYRVTNWFYRAYKCSGSGFRV